MNTTNIPKKVKTSVPNIRCIKRNYFGQTLKELRTEKGLTQEQCANLIGATQALWSAYEVGKTRPDLDMIIEIAKVLQINPFTLLGKSLDKSKFFDPVYELSFDDYEDISNNVIEKYRKQKLTQKIKAL